MRFARRYSPTGWMKNLADVVAYVTFQSPVYVAILLTVGADWHQIAAAVSSNIGGIDDDGCGIRLFSSITADVCSK
ncbi:L-alanine exporter AlaE [Leclercia adecarboxylata]|uniref:L-alanine exporter AlaE n=1 Tax=Leclercia adecarboxylata TaxID=83655 RepID=A0A4U9IG24_9ENTR|nr:L-alanine exporter AlaE [Leclercia adecarboxylata]